MTDVTFLTLAADQETPRKRIQVAKLGRFKDPRYGTFTITEQDVSSWVRNLEEHFGGEVPIDRDHATDKGTSSEAMAWIRNLAIEGDAVTADVEWTPAGEELVRQKRYRYISPTFVSALRDQQGNTKGPALLRAALTNNPFLHDMPAVSLDAGAFQTATPDPAGGPDTRRTMGHLHKIALALGLDENADEATVLAAVEQAKTTSPTVTLDAATALVQAEGKVILSKDDHAKLTTDAAKAGALEARVVALEADAQSQRFTLAFDKALDEGRVDAKQETRDAWKAQFDATGDSALALLSTLPQVINLATSGQSGRDQAHGDAPAGVDPESFQLDQKVQAFLLEHPELDYLSALDRVVATQGA